MIEHLGHAERHWFQEVALGSAEPLPWPDDTIARHPDAVFAFYRDQIERSNALLTGEDRRHHVTRNFPDGG